MAIQYYMRAYKISAPAGYVDWVVNDVPDSTGAFSGYPTNQLINITVNRVVQSKVANFLKPNQSLGGTDGEFFHINSYDWKNAVSPIPPPTVLTGFAVERGISAVTSVTTATNASPIVVTSSTNHNLVSGQLVTINGVTGNTNANGTWPIIVISPTAFSLTGSTGNGTYVSGGNIFTPADFSTLTWDETNNVWRFVLNTNGDGTTLGASQSLKVNNFIMDGYIAIGPDPADTGAIRLSNNTYIFSETNPAGVDVQLIGADLNNRIKLGNLTTDNVYIPGFIDVDGYVQHDGSGSNTPASGFIREQNNTSIVVYKNVNQAFSDVTTLSSNSFNQIVIGDTVNTGTVYNTSSATFNITAATAASPVVITVSAPTTFVTGQSVTINGITGTIGTDPTNGLNGKSFSIVVVDTTHFSLTGSNGVGLVYTSGGTAATNNVHAFQEGGVSQVEIGTSFIRFPAAVTSPFLLQTTATGSNSGQNLTIQSQNAGLGGTNGGNLTLTTGTGASNGLINLQTGGTTRVTLSDTTETHIHQIITFANTVANPTITQNTTTTTPTTLTISAQPTSQAATTGGVLALSSGSGTTAAGNVNIQTAGTNQIIVSPTFITPGTTTSTGGSVVIRGSLEVVGTTTTVDSTVVDIIGRIIHANWADPVASPNVAVPSQVVGYSVHRGNSSGVPRDGAALIWTEGALNSGADGYWRAVTYPGDGVGTDNFSIGNSLNAVGSMAGNYAASSDPNPVLGFLAASGSFRAANNVPTVVGRSITPSTTLDVSATNGTATLPLATITVVSTTGFTTSGTLLIQSSTGTQTVTYTGTNATQFTGVSGGGGTIVTGGIVAQTNNSTTYNGANGVPIGATMVVATTIGFPPSGTLRVVTHTSNSATAPVSVQTVTYTSTSGGNTFNGLSGATGFLFVGDAVTSAPIPGISDLVLVGTDFGNRILWGSPTNNTGHIFNTPSGFFYDFQVNSVSQLQLGRSDVDASGFAETIQISPTVSNPRLIQQTLPNTGAANGFNLGVFAQSGQLQTGGAANNNGGQLFLVSGAQGLGGAGAVGIDGYVELRTGFTSKMRVFPTVALSAADNNSILYFENLFRVDTAQITPRLRQDDRTTASGTGETFTIQAQNETGATSTGGALTLTSGTGTSTHGNVNIQTGAGTRVLITTSFTSFNDTAAIEAYRITPVSGGTTTLQAASTVTALTYRQADLVSNGGTGATTTLQAQNETGTTSTGGALVLTSGTGTTTAGNVQLQTGAVDRVIVHPTFTEFRDTAEALRITPVSAGITQITYAATDTAAQINQTTTGSAVGATMTVQAQNAAVTGGVLALTSGTGVAAANAGNVNIQTGGVTKLQVTPAQVNFNGTAAATAFSVIPNSAGTTELLFAKPVTAVTIDQTANDVGAGANWFIHAQDGSTTGGNLTLSTGAGAPNGTMNFQTGTVTRLSLNDTTLFFASTVTAPTINQTTTGGSSGQALTVQAQNAVTTGGNLVLTSGTGGTTNGSINLQVGGTTTASVVPNKFVFNKGWRRNVTPITTTYQILATDDYVAITSIVAPFTITLPAAPTTGDSYTFKDVGGNAAANNVTISGNGANIDGAATIVLTQNYSSLKLTYTGTQWSIS